MTPKKKKKKKRKEKKRKRFLRNSLKLASANLILKIKTENI